MLIYNYDYTDLLYDIIQYYRYYIGFCSCFVH
jgi:hypothetical protein